MPYKKDFAEFIDKFIVSWFLAMLWVIALQVNEYRKWHKTTIKNMIIHLFLASFVWWVTRSFLPDSLWAVKPAMTALSWYLYKTILIIIEKDWIKLFINKYKWK